VFTQTEFAHRIPSDRLIVLLDHVPREAQVRLPGALPRRVDLGSHVGLAVEGERDADGSEASVLMWVDGTMLRRLSHRHVMSSDTSGERLPAVVDDLLRPLLRGESC